MSEQAKCELCGEPMPPGEEMFKYHGYSCECPRPPLSRLPKNEVAIPRAQHEALVAAAKALKRYHHPPSRIDAPDCPCCNCEGERAIAALRAVGIQIEDQS